MKKLYPYRERMRRTWRHFKFLGYLQFLIDNPLAGIPYWENRSAQYCGIDRSNYPILHSDEYPEAK